MPQPTINEYLAQVAENLQDGLQCLHYDNNTHRQCQTHETVMYSEDGGCNYPNPYCSSHAPNDEKVCKDQLKAQLIYALKNVQVYNSNW